MNIKQLTLAAAAVSATFLGSGVVSSAQAAVLGSGDTCAKVSFSYLDCAGAFGGNDKGAQGTGLSNLDELFDGEWVFEGDNESGLVSFDMGDKGDQNGTASTALSGFGAIAVKAGNSYSLYTVEDLSSFEWSTAGVNTVGGKKKKNIPGLSHLSIYRQAHPVKPPVEQEVPEPSVLLGLIGMIGAGLGSRKKLS
ncbi:MAG: PEP-CTERM sorting domain-containing protein [Cyanobacteria bacterium J06581_3]